MADELCFVQFPHAGGEHGPDDSRGELKRWERGESDHARKFMVTPGAWRERLDGTNQEGELVFWGEWEADSNVTVAPDNVAGGPAWLHRPFFEGPQNARAETVPQNTDPFVFGERFLYTFCRQRKNRHLRQLARGTVILFGSKKNHRFVLDTVFVVDESVDHTRETYLEVAVPRTNSVFRATTLDPMYAWQRTKGCRLYFAATVEQPISGMFSFVPCRPADENKTFARPAIELAALVNPALTQQAGTTPFDDISELARVWRAVVDQVLDAGLVLGVRVELPRRRSRT